MDALVSRVGVETEYHQVDATFRSQFNQEMTPANVAIISTLAEVENAAPVELDSFYSAVDPDGLDVLRRCSHYHTGARIKSAKCERNVGR